MMAHKPSKTDRASAGHWASVTAAAGSRQWQPDCRYRLKPVLLQERNAHRTYRTETDSSIGVLTESGLIRLALFLSFRIEEAVELLPVILG